MIPNLNNWRRNGTNLNTRYGITLEYLSINKISIKEQNILEICTQLNILIICEHLNIEIIILHKILIHMINDNIKYIF